MYAFFFGAKKKYFRDNVGPARAIRHPVRGGFMGMIPPFKLLIANLPINEALCNFCEEDGINKRKYS